MLLKKKLKEYSVFFLVLFFSGKGMSQTTLSSGVYKTTVGEYGYGYCCILNDSSFVFLETKSLAFSKTAVTTSNINDTLIKIGKGTWRVKDSFLFFHFKPVNITLLNKTQLNYKSSTEKPYDSLLLSLNVSKSNDTNNHPYLLVLPGLMQSVIQKNISIKLPLQTNDTVVKIFMNYDKPFTIHLNEGNNKHVIDLKITDNKEDLTLIKESDVKIKIYSKNKLPPQRLLTKDEGDLEKLIKILKFNAEIFPDKKNILNYFISLVGIR